MQTPYLQRCDANDISRTASLLTYVACCLHAARNTAAVRTAEALISVGADLGAELTAAIGAAQVGRFVNLKLNSRNAAHLFCSLAANVRCLLNCRAVSPDQHQLPQVHFELTQRREGIRRNREIKGFDSPLPELDNVARLIPAQPAAGKDSQGLGFDVLLRVGLSCHYTARCDCQCDCIPFAHTGVYRQP